MASISWLSITSIIIQTIFVWLIQPWIVYYCCLKKRKQYPPRWNTLMALIVFSILTIYLSQQWHELLFPSNYHPSFGLIWLMFGYQTIHYLHLLSVGSEAFQSHFGLTNFSRVLLFTLSPATIIFKNKKEKQQQQQQKNDASKNNINTNNDNHDYNTQQHLTILQQKLKIALIELSSLVLFSGFYILLMERLAIIIIIINHVPLLLQQVIYLFMLAASTSCIPTLVLELPIRYIIILLLNYNNKQDDTAYSNVDIVIIPLTKQPHLATSPRDLWHRWSVAAGYHFRKGYYEPILSLLQNKNNKNNNNRWLATTVTFGVNAFFHCTLYGYWITQTKWSMEFMHLLLTVPISTFLIQDVVFGRKGLLFQWSKESVMYKLCNWIMVMASFTWALPYLTTVQSLPPTLSEFCHLFLPFLHYHP